MLKDQELPDFKDEQFEEAEIEFPDLLRKRAVEIQTNDKVPQRA